MLSREDNELLCRVGRGTPMGELMRQYWIPCLPSTEFPEPDSPVKRMTLLGENFVMFRDSEGRMGALAEACPHRGASMYFGRNEDCGLRCVYHGWKFDIHGNCVDMPSEPPESTYKDKVKARAYPCHEVNHMIWVYLGPRKEPPPFPPFEINTLPAERVGPTADGRHVSIEIRQQHVARFLDFGVAHALSGDTRQFLVESVVLCLFGGLIGVGFGQLLTMTIANIPGADLLDMARIPLWAIGLSFGFAATVGVFFGMFPAIKAARLDPIEALRHE